MDVAILAASTAMPFAKELAFGTFFFGFLAVFSEMSLATVEATTPWLIYCIYVHDIRITGRLSLVLHVLPDMLLVVPYGKAFYGILHFLDLL